MPDPGERAQLLERLRAEPRRQTGFDRLLSLAHPLWRRTRSNATLEAWLREHLDALVEAGWLTVPKQQRLWRSTRPALPEWVRLVSERKAESPQAIRHGEHWLPALAFARHLRDRRALERARTINRFLKARPRLEPAVPLRERSLEIFGDEKALDAFLDASGALFGGRLSLNILGTFIVPLPIPYERGPQGAHGRSILVVENAHTFYSFSRWNEHAGHYAAIAYSAGNALSGASATGSQAAESYIDIIRSRLGAGDIEYFGDLDPSGVRIPAAVDRARRDLGLPGLLPAESLYRWLLDHGRPTPMLRSTEKGPVDGLLWLGEALAERVKALFQGGERIAQEALSYRHLMEHFRDGSM